MKKMVFLISIILFLQGCKELPDEISIKEELQSQELYDEIMKGKIDKAFDSFYKVHPDYVDSNISSESLKTYQFILYIKNDNYE